MMTSTSTLTLERPRAIRLPTQFAVFGTFYMTAFLVDITEKWDYPAVALATLILVLAISRGGVRRWTFVAFLVLSSLQILLWDFPNLGNHNNIYLLFNLFLIAAIVHASLRRKAPMAEDELFEILKPPLRVMLSLVYFFAGFHKLNPDFFHAEVGCAAEFTHGILAAFLVPNLPLPEVALFATGVFVLVWEMGGAVALWFRRLQAPVLLLCWVMHSVLAQIVFFDFSSLAFALFLLFIPGSHWPLVLERPVQAGSIRIPRHHAYLYINVMAAVMAGVLFALFGVQSWIHRIQGTALVLASLVFAWPIIDQVLRDRRRLPWEGVRMWSRRVPGWAVAFPLFVVFFGMNPYLGLRTAGTFTMFSNLRTEGERSNHFLLGSNPLKIWGYQEDLVEIIDLDPQPPRPRRSLVGYLLPAVEFKKWIYEWRQMGVEGLHATFEYQGRVYQTADLVWDNPWEVGKRDLEMFLLDFRPVQKVATPNRCRW